MCRWHLLYPPASESLLLGTPGNWSPGRPVGLWEGSPPTTPHGPWKIPESFPGPGAAGSWPDPSGTSPLPPGVSEGCLLPDRSQGCVLPPTVTQGWRWRGGGGVAHAARQGPRAEPVSSSVGVRPAAVNCGRPSSARRNPRLRQSPCGVPRHALVGVGLGTLRVPLRPLPRPRGRSRRQALRGGLRKITFKVASSSLVWFMWP